MIDPRDVLLVAETYRRAARVARNATNRADDTSSVICLHFQPRWARWCWPLTRAVLAAVACWLDWEASTAELMAQEVQEEQQQ